MLAQPRASWSSRRCTAPAATACWSARRRPRPSARRSARASSPRPSNYIAQPTLALSTCPTFVERASRRATSTCAPTCCPARRRPRARRPHARRAARRLAGRQLVAGRRHQGHLGARGLKDSTMAAMLSPHRQRALLDGAPHRARREHGAPARRHVPDVAAALPGRRSPGSPGPSRGRCRSSPPASPRRTTSSYPALDRRERAARS